MEDAQIIDLLLRRSEDAVEALQRKFGGLCRSIISRVLTDSRDVEECLSDTYLRVWESIPPQNPRRLDSYLARIARNLALDRYDYNSAHMRSSALTCAYEELSDCLPARQTPTQAAEFRAFLNRFLREQSRQARVLFVRRYWYGQTVAELAREMGCSQEKVKSSLFRTRNKLREAMIKEEIYL